MREMTPPMAIAGFFGQPTPYALPTPAQSGATVRADRTRYQQQSTTNRRIKREARVAAGLCGECGVEALAEGRRSCEPCLKKKRKDGGAAQAEPTPLPAMCGYWTVQEAAPAGRSGQPRHWCTCSSCGVTRRAIPDSELRERKTKRCARCNASQGPWRQTQKASEP